MAISVVMPALEMAQETGKLIAWRKKEGERVAKGEPLLEVETDKAVLEIEAPADGILAGVKVEEGAVVPVGQTIAWIVGPGEAPPKEAAVDSSGRAVTTVARSASMPSQAAAEVAAGPKISPKARRLAREHGVDITRLRGTGGEGAISAEDVMAAVAAKGSPAVPVAETLSLVARLMAERTAQSWTTVPHFFVVREADAGALLEARERLRPPSGVKPTHTDLLVALVARVLAKHPRMNASWVGDRIHLNPEVNVAVAMAVGDGVVAPVIHRADTTTLAGIAIRRSELTERARAGRLHPADIAGATFTISNLGMYGVDAFSAIISPPQAAVLAVGRIADRVVAVDGKPGVRPMITLTLSTDHRVADGARAAAFLNDVVEALGDPGKWLG